MAENSVADLRYNVERNLITKRESDGKFISETMEQVVSGGLVCLVSQSNKTKKRGK